MGIISLYDLHEFLSSLGDASLGLPCAWTGGVEKSPRQRNRTTGHHWQSAQGLLAAMSGQLRGGLRAYEMSILAEHLLSARNSFCGECPGKSKGAG